MTDTSKLIELRHKTDSELPAMIERELDRGLALASVAATKASPLYKKAGRIYSTMKTLLPTPADVHQPDRSRLESKLRELGAALERTPAKEIPRQMVFSAQGD